MASLPHTIRCGNCHHTIDGVRIRLGGSINAELGIALCRECKDEPDCDSCHRTPYGHGITLFPVQGDDVIQPSGGQLSYCGDCITAHQSRGIRIESVPIPAIGDPFDYEELAVSVESLLGLVEDIPVPSIRVLPPQESESVEDGDEDDDEDVEDEYAEVVVTPTFTVLPAEDDDGLLSIRDFRRLARRARARK